ncbi:uncharacterized protein LOC104907944 [Beta vulgaris subsp. vulgaris]|uniref:uncharacterized protein LOC104907944 n=1 Tax=Beta vulgaris subsp. vulgaris TaxID=3555 RepID=UPI0020366A71|nr:uncharacterized protein LOC104907944 [Beta vulgaris subsp. vulgaris]
MATKCNCRIPAKILRSWTHDNPGRSFYACKFSDVHTRREGCGFFRWVEKNQEEWQKVVINELVLEKRLLTHEVTFLKSEITRIQDTKPKVENLVLLNKKSGASKRQNAPKNCGFITGLFVGVVASFLILFLIVNVM